MLPSTLERYQSKCYPDHGPKRKDPLQNPFRLPAACGIIEQMFDHTVSGELVISRHFLSHPSEMLAQERSTNMWRPNVVLSNEVRSRVMDLARERHETVGQVLAGLIVDGLGMQVTEVERQQLTFDLGEPDWLEQLRLRHVG